MFELIGETLKPMLPKIPVGRPELPVMSVLLLNVPFRRLHRRMTERERRVPRLPPQPRAGQVLVRPTGRPGLELPDHVRDGAGLR